MKKIWIAMALISIASHSFAEVIELESGLTVEGPLLEKTADFIRIDLYGMPMTYYVDQITSVDQQSVEKYFGVEQKEEQPKIGPPVADATNELSIEQNERMEKLSESVVIVRAFREHKPFLMGTGFIVQEGELVVTNFHLIFEAKSIEIETIKGEVFPVEFIANYNHALDAGILKVPPTGLPALRLGDSLQLMQGEPVFSIGHPDAQEFQFHKGGYIGYMEMDHQEFLYFKIQSKQGSSGGPVFNEKGDVIAVSTLGRSDIKGYSYGIPINAVKPLLNHNKIIAVNELAESLGAPFRLTYYGRGAALEGKHAEAAAYFQQALDLDADYLPATIGLARAFTALNRFKEAEQAWHQISVRDPKHVEAHLYLGKRFLTRELLTKAIVHLELAAALAPQSIHTYNDLGIAYGKAKNYDKAIAMYQKTIDLDPLYATGYFNLSVAYYNKHNLLQAKEFCAQAIKLGYNVPQSYIMELGL